MTRLLPDADQLVLDVIRSALGPDNVGNFIPADLAEMLPYITAARITGPPRHPRFAGNPTIDVQTWADDRKTASDLAESVRVAFYEAWRTQTVYPSGWISHQRCTSEPANLPLTGAAANAPQDLYRFQATYRLVVRK